MMSAARLLLLLLLVVAFVHARPRALSAKAHHHKRLLEEAKDEDLKQAFAPLSGGGFSLKSLVPFLPSDELVHSPTRQKAPHTTLIQKAFQRCVATWDEKMKPKMDDIYVGLAEEYGPQLANVVVPGSGDFVEHGYTAYQVAGEGAKVKTKESSKKDFAWAAAGISTDVTLGIITGGISSLMALGATGAQTALKFATSKYTIRVACLEVLLNQAEFGADVPQLTATQTRRLNKWYNIVMKAVSLPVENGFQLWDKTVIKLGQPVPPHMANLPQIILLEWAKSAGRISSVLLKILQAPVESIQNALQRMKMKGEGPNNFMAACIPDGVEIIDQMVSDYDEDLSKLILQFVDYLGASKQYPQTASGARVDCTPNPASVVNLFGVLKVFDSRFEVRDCAAGGAAHGLQGDCCARAFEKRGQRVFPCMLDTVVIRGHTHEVCRSSADVMPVLSDGGPIRCDPLLAWTYGDYQVEDCSAGGHMYGLRGHCCTKAYEKPDGGYPVPCRLDEFDLCHPSAFWV